jgi:hypothetical protein
MGHDYKYERDPTCYKHRRDFGLCVCTDCVRERDDVRSGELLHRGRTDGERGTVQAGWNDSGASDVVFWDNLASFLSGSGRFRPRQ